MSRNLDEIDRKILAEIQADGRITNVELAKRVGISPPPCLRRVRTLEEAGYIQGYRGLLDPRRLGFDVTVFASVHLSSQAEADLRAFETFVRAEPLVRECWMLSGEVDFVKVLGHGNFLYVLKRQLRGCSWLETLLAQLGRLAQFYCACAAPFPSRCGENSPIWIAILA